MACRGLELLASPKCRVFGLEAPFTLTTATQFEYSSFATESTTLQSATLFVKQIA